MIKSLLNIFNACVISIAVVFYSAAQPAKGMIDGTVNSEKKEPIEFVTVLLRQPGDSALIKGAITDTSGRYRFQEILPGKYILTFTFIGYHKESVAIELQNDFGIYSMPAITLKEDTQLLGEVVVRGQKPLIEYDGDKLVLNVQNSAVAAGGSAAELLERSPGVTIDQNDQISLNGKAGVTIMIDGKITYLPPTELAALLRSMNANNVSTVEIISNPSARYDATGNSGVINIRLKKNTLEGFNGSGTVGTGYGRYGKVNGNVNLNYRSKKWSHFLNYGYVFNKRFYYAETDRTSFPEGQPLHFIQQIDRIQKLPSHTWQAGTEWQWNTSNSISLSTTGSFNERLTDNISSTQIRRASANEPDSTFTIDNNQKYEWSNVSASIGYKHKFVRPGSELTMDVDYSDYTFRLNDNFTIKWFDRDGIFKNQYNVISDQPSAFNIYTARTDYSHQMSEKAFLETGIKYSYVKTTNDILFTNNNNVNGQFEIDPTRSSDFNYSEQIGAAYVNLKTKISNVDAQFGLRAEQTSYQGVSVRANKSIERNYLNVFPSVTLNRSFSKNYQLGLSYSYRIDRPSFKDLYPYVFYFDPFDSQFGNPELLPQLTHSIQISQTVAKDYVINFGYSSIAQYMTFAILLNDDQVSSYAIKKNFGTFQNYYLTAIAPVKISDGWTMNLNLSVFFNSFKTQFLNDIYTSSGLSGIANVSQTIDLPWGLTGEITGVYNAPVAVGLFQNQSLGSLNAGVQKHFLEKRATLRINVTDIFMTNQLRNGTAYPGFDMRISQINETRVVRLNFTYTIGKAGKVSRKRNTLEDEQKRIGAN